MGFFQIISSWNAYSAEDMYWILIRPLRYEHHVFLAITLLFVNSWKWSLTHLCKCRNNLDFLMVLRDVMKFYHWREISGWYHPGIKEYSLKEIKEHLNRSIHQETGIEPKKNEPRRIRTAKWCLHYRINIAFDMFIPVYLFLSRLNILISGKYTEDQSK